MKPAVHIFLSGFRRAPGLSRAGFGSAERAFTMIEIALSIAVVAFALVAIMGVLPTGLNVQRDNREETIINQDAAYILQAIRSGTTNLPLFSRNIDMIQITNQRASGNTLPNPYNGMPNPLLGADINTTPEMLLSFLTTPKYVRLRPNEEVTNHVTARIRAFSGPLADRGDSAPARELAFTYLLFCEIIPFEAFPSRVIEEEAPKYAPAMSPAEKISRMQSNNLYEVRLEFRWPVLPDPANNNTSLGVPGNGRLVYRSLIAGSITNYYAIPGVNGAPGSGPLLSRFAHLAYTNPLPSPSP